MEKTKLKINEIFSTIQGEGSNTGTSATFIRFSKCNLSCKWCDTEFEKFKYMTVSDIFTAVTKLPSKLIVISGGEPTLQYKGLVELSKLLRNSNYEVAIETNGTIPIDISEFDHVTISPKEKVAMANTNQEKNRMLKQFECHDFKIVYEGQDIIDLNYYMRIVKALKGYYIQPLSNSKSSMKKCFEIVRENPQWKLSLQTHKIIGVK